MKDYLNTRDANELIDGAKDAEVLKLAAKYRDGVRIASPVFDGAAEEEIFNLLKKGRLAGQRPGDLVRRPDRRSLSTAK